MLTMFDREPRKWESAYVCKKHISLVVSQDGKAWCFDGEHEVSLEDVWQTVVCLLNFADYSPHELAEIINSNQPDE